MKASVLLMFLVSSMAIAQNNDIGTTQPSTFRGFNSRSVVGELSFTGSESTMSPRFFRSGTPGDACGEFSSGNFQYKTVSFTSSSAGELTVSFDPGACGTGVFVTFHSGSFNPANICENYVWSFGSSQEFTETFSVPPSTEMVMVVSGVANAPGVACGPVSYQIDGTQLIVPVPTLGEWGLIGFLISLAVAGVWMMRRRAASLA